MLISNCSNNYGGYQFPEKLIPLMILNCLEHKPLPVYGQGLNVRDWLYVRDHCDAINCIIKTGKPGQTYNIGGHNEMKNIDIVNTICQLLDEFQPSEHLKSYTELITYVTDRPGHDLRYAIDASKIQHELGLAAQRDLCHRHPQNRAMVSGTRTVVAKHPEQEIPAAEAGTGFPAINFLRKNTMIKFNLLTVIIAALLLVLLSACMPRFLYNAATPDVVVVSPSTSQVTAPGSDAHFVQVDDYFVLEQPLTDQSFVYAALGKMLTAPGTNTNSQGKFRRDLDNQEIWTQYFGKTRIARTADYILNQEVVFPNFMDSYGNYRAPESSTEARTGWWMKARVTDISELHKGFLTVSGGYKVNLNALRVATQ